MSRPSNPSYATRTFAPDANYPAGPGLWALQPTKVEPPGAGTTGFTPDTGDAAEFRNKLFYDAFVQDVNAKASIDALCTFVGQMQALSFQAAQPFGGAEGVIQRAVFNAPKKTWYTWGSSGTSDGNIRSNVRAGGDAWSAAASVSGGAGATGCYGDVDTSGNMIITTVGNDHVYEFDGSAWTVRTTSGLATGGGHTPVAYDPVHNLWCVLQTGAAGGVRPYTSSNRTAWTLRAAVTASTNAAQARMACKKSTGRLVAVVAFDAGADLKVSTSDDGGITWTARTDIPNTIVATDAFSCSLMYNATTNTWIYVMCETTGTPTCKVWRSSDDGVTWTNVATLANHALREVAAVGYMLVSVTSAGDIVYSLDDGATWKPAAFQITGTTSIGVFAGGGGLLAISDDAIFPSAVRMGDPNLTALT